MIAGIVFPPRWCDQRARELTCTTSSLSATRRIRLAAPPCSKGNVLASAKVVGACSLTTRSIFSFCARSFSAALNIPAAARSAARQELQWSAPHEMGSLLLRTANPARPLHLIRPAPAGGVDVPSPPCFSSVLSEFIQILLLPCEGLSMLAFPMTPPMT